MKNFFRSTGFKILLGAVVVLLAVLLYTQSVGNSLLANMINFVSSPMQAVSTSAKESVSDLVDGLTDDPEALKAQIAALEEENRAYREQLVDYYEYQRLVAQYESMLGIKETNEDFQMISASVIGRDPNDLFYSFSIDIGYLDGVSQNDPVITGDGLVGWVSQVYATTSKVTTILSEETQVGAASKERRESGVINSDIKLADEGLVKLAFLDADTQIQAGDLITTTGLSGLFPEDLIIGSVTEIGHETYDVSMYALVQPYVDVKTVMDVFVVTDFYGKGEISASTGDEDTSSGSSASGTASSQPENGDDTASSASSPDGAASGDESSAASEDGESSASSSEPAEGSDTSESEGG